MGSTLRQWVRLHAEITAGDLFVFEQVEGEFGYRRLWLVMPVWLVWAIVIQDLILAYVLVVWLLLR